MVTYYQTVKYIDFSPLVLLMLWLSLTAINPAYGQADRQKQLIIRGIIERGNVLMAKQLFKEALSEYEKCLDMEPGNITGKSNIVLLHDNWGVYYFRHNQYQDAQVEWETALQLNPNDSKAKSNMLVPKNTLAHLGLDLNTESQLIKEQKKAEQEPKKAEEGSAVVILGTHRNKPDAQDKNYVDQYYSHEPGGPTANASNNQAEAKTNVQEPKTNAPEPRTISTPAATTQPVQPLIEEQLSCIERKVYGHPLDELPVTKRLDKLETDNFGQVSTAPILQRVQKLNELYR